jgi:hypothetical protein
VYGKKKHVHNSSNNPPKVFSLLLKKRILEKTISKTLRAREWKMWKEKRERESEKSSSITLAQDMVSWE